MPLCLGLTCCTLNMNSAAHPELCHNNTAKAAFLDVYLQKSYVKEAGLRLTFPYVAVHPAVRSFEDSS